MKWICDQYEESIYAKKVSSLIKDYHGYVKEADNFPIIFSDNVLSKNDFKKIGLLTQIKWLLWRTYIDYKRNLSSIFLRFIIYLVSNKCKNRDEFYRSILFFIIYDDY